MTHATHIVSLADVGHDLVTRDPLKLAVAGYLARYHGSTLRDYTRDLKIYLNWCDRNDLPPLQAMRGHVELYVRWLEDTGWATSTVNRRVTVVCGFYRYALRDEIIAKDPCLWVDRPKVDRAAQRRTYLTALEFGKWMDAARLHGPIPFALGSLIGLRGLRISEATMLNVEGVIKVGGYETINFVRKGGKQVTLALPAPVGMAVRNAIGDRTEGPLLLNQWRSRMDRACATRVIRQICDEAKINRDISPHSFRRTFITTSLAHGHPSARRTGCRWSCQQHDHRDLRHGRKELGPRRLASTCVIRDGNCWMSAPLEQLIAQLETTGSLAHRLVEEDVWDMERRDVDRILRATELLTVSVARGLEQARTSQAAGEVTAVRKVDAQFVADALVRASHEANRARSRRPL